MTDPAGRIVFANEAYLDLTGAENAASARTVERVFAGNADVSEAIYRLAQAARGGKRRERGGPRHRLPDGAAPGTASGCGRSTRAGRARDVWTVADVTRERERQENVFQELQHAIDYLDHAPAGFFSAEGDGAIVYMNATLADWLGYDLAEFGAGRAEARATSSRGDGAALIEAVPPKPGEVATEIIDIDLKPAAARPAAGAAAAPRRLRRRRRARRLAHAGARPRGRATTSPRPCAPPRCASRASSTTRRSPSPPSTRRAGSPAPTRRSPRSSATALKAAGDEPLGLCRPSPSATARRSPRRSCGAARGDERDRAGRGDAGRASRPAPSASSSPASRPRRRRARPRSSTRSTRPSSASSRRSSPRARRCRRSASSPAAWRTTSTTC